MSNYHQPVMLHECMQGLGLKAQGTYVDVTFGGGGHSRKILELLEGGRLIAFDQDPDTRANVPDDARLTFVNQNFRYLKNFLKLYKAIPVDGILADLGVSSWQIDQAERGFSTRFEGPLDMRMDKQGGVTARQVINDYEPQELANVLRLYGELKNAWKIAREIEYQRKQQSIETTGQLKELLQKFAIRGKENKFFAQVFQALRIEVNSELEVLQDLLRQSAEVLAPGGRLVIMSYHSLEDRLVKNFMKAGNFTGEQEKDFYGNTIAPLKTVGKMIIATEQEQELNPRSRSARLRIAEKL